MFDVDDTCRQFLSGTGSGGRSGTNLLEKWREGCVRLNIKIKGVVQTGPGRRERMLIILKAKKRGSLPSKLNFQIFTPISNLTGEYRLFGIRGPMRLVF